jgi:RNA polymerase sigma-70 factor (ECF subfamily)
MNNRWFYPEAEMFSEVVSQESLDQDQNLVAAKQGVFAQGKEAHSLEVRALQNEETRLIQSAVTGNLAAFNQLVEMYQDSLYRWAFSLVKDEAVAEDIVQSAFITAYERLSSFRGGSLKGWLFTIVRNRSYDELRRQKRHPSHRLEESSENDLSALEVIPDSIPNPEDYLITTEQEELIDRMLNRLPDVFQQVVRLIDMEGLDYQEAANILGLPLGTVKSRLTRARLKMRYFFQQAKWL